MMKRSWLITIACAALLPTAATAGADAVDDLRAQRGTLWVANRTLDTVTLFEGATGKVLDTIETGRHPSDVTVPRGTERAYLTVEGSDVVSVFSTATRSLVTEIATGPDPHHVESTADGSKVVFGEFGANRLGVITTGSNAFTEFGASTDETARTHQVYPTPDGRLFLAVNIFKNELAAINASTGRLAFTIPLEGLPSEVIVAPDGTRAYVSIRTLDEVHLVDLRTRTVTRELRVGTQADTLQVTPDGNTLIVALRGQPAQLVFVDTERWTARPPLTIAGEGTIAGHQYLSANGRFTFAAFQGPAAGVAVVDNETRRVVTRWAYPGGGEPHGMHYDDPAGTSGPVMTIVSRSARVTRTGRARIGLRCGQESVVECRGRLTLGRRGRRIAAGRFAVPADRTARVRVKLTRAGYRALLRRGISRARATASAADRLGNTSRATRTLKLLAPGQ